MGEHQGCGLQNSLMPMSEHVPLPSHLPCPQSLRNTAVFSGEQLPRPAWCALSCRAGLTLAGVLPASLLLALAQPPQKPEKGAHT